ncbi:MAG: hypothetical protein KY453_12340, partial [Gemmatimonadetes bacterium]|nr:hypothetical protein [Gemmatimonadota bacterium]
RNDAPVPANPPSSGGGAARSSTTVAAVVDANLLVYRFDARFPGKQVVADRLLRDGIAGDTLRVVGVLYSEDFEHERWYGGVLIIDPFQPTSGATPAR